MDERKALEMVASAMRAAQGGPWMAAIWRAERGRVELVRRVTNDFQSGDFGVATMLLAADLMDEKGRIEGGNPDMPPPLRVADFIKTDGETAACRSPDLAQWREPAELALSEMSEKGGQEQQSTGWDSDFESAADAEQDEKLAAMAREMDEDLVGVAEELAKDGESVDIAKELADMEHEAAKRVLSTMFEKAEEDEMNGDEPPEERTDDPTA